MDKSLKLYIISDEYVSYLRKIDHHVLSNKDNEYVFNRKYLGVVATVGELKYFVPLASPKDTDYIIDEYGNKKIRKSIIPIMRIVHREKDGNLTLLGKLKFSSMIPVIDSEVIQYDITTEQNIDYKNLVYKEWDFIRQNRDKIFKSANTIHTQKVNRVKGINYLDSTVDFLLLECKAIEYAAHKHAINKVVSM